MSGRRYKPLSAAQAKDMIGFGQVTGFAQSPPGNPVFWATQENGKRDLSELTARTADAFTAMINSYAPGNPSVSSAISGLHALDPTSGTFKIYLASSIKYALPPNAATRRPTTGPLPRMHPSLHVAVGAENTHRTNFSCAEMHAVNNMLWDTNPAGDNAALQIQGMIVTNGTSNALDRGSGGGKATMLPCLSERADMLGCKAVLTDLGVDFEDAV
jgi:hypothetical protein